MGKHIHVHLHDSVGAGAGMKTTKGVTVWGGSNEKTEKSFDAGTSEGAKKAAQTRASHGSAHAYHKGAAGFPITHKGHAEAAALHQHARMMQENKNPMFAGKSKEASERAWKASKALGYNG